MLMQGLPAIPLYDMRSGGPVALAAARPSDLDELRGYCLAYVPKPLHALVPVADAVARRWLARSASPYVAEVAKIAAIAQAPGVFLVNTAYEWACTVAACHAGGAPVMLRTLDWPFGGLGRKVAVVRQRGPGGEFWNVTWPGAVGVLTALAPGRFAATINQAPLFRRTRGDVLRFADYAVNALRTLARVRHAPPDHVLRQVFETAASYSDAKAMLSRIPMARPVLISLAGTRPHESCVIEREETAARVIDGPIVVANDWQEPRTGWEARSCGGPFETDSRDRRAALAARMADRTRPFAWLAPPVRNWATRIAVEMNAGEGTLRVAGFEPVGGVLPAAQATQVFDLARERNAA
jgi:hypothetical protein